MLGQAVLDPLDQIVKDLAWILRDKDNRG
jgi:hypothetical protein